MSEEIRVNITRAGVASPIAANLLVQLDKMSAAESASYQGSDPHFTYNCYTTMLPMSSPQLVLFRDHMIDQVTIDPLTSTGRTYLIISDPDPHTLDAHWQWVCVRMRGT